MATQVQNRRGTTAEHSTFTGAVGELTIDTDKDTVVVHDGATAGGRPLLREDQSNLPTSAPSTGIYNASGSLAISANSVGRLFVAADGTVSVKGAGTAAFSVNGGAPNNSLVIDSSGRAGLGTSSPGAGLHIVSIGQTTSALNTAGDLNTIISDTGASPGSGGSLVFAANSGAWRFASIKGLTTNGTDNTQGDLAFSTRQSTTDSTLTERLRITAAGNVGVGTTNPESLLHLETDGTALRIVRGSSIGFAYNTGTAATSPFRIQSNSGSVDLYSAAGQPITFSAGGTEKAQVDGSGRLLVGTSSTATTANTKLVIQRNNAPRSSGGPEAALFLTTGTYGYALQMGAYNSGSLSTSYTWISSVRSSDAFYDGVNVPPLAFMIAHSECMRINVQKELLIGYTTDNGNYKLQVNSQIFATSSTIATSDGRYKKNVATLDGCLDLVKGLRPVSFEWEPQHDITRIDDDGNEVLVREGHNFPDGTQVGFIAQEVQEALVGKPWLNSVIKQNVRPAVIDDDGNELAQKEEFLGIAEGNLIAVLTSALQEAVERIETLEAKVAALEAQ